MSKFRVGQLCHVSCDGQPVVIRGLDWRGFATGVAGRLETGELLVFSETQNAPYVVGEVGTGNYDWFLTRYGLTLFNRNFVEPCETPESQSSVLQRVHSALSAVEKLMSTEK
jgi:hypothetical protein